MGTSEATERILASSARDESQRDLLGSRQDYCTLGDFLDQFKKIKYELAKQHNLMFWDIETRPMKAWIWGLGKQYVSHEQVAEDSKIISIQWMFEGDRRANWMTWDNEQNDARMLEEFVKIASEASCMISQNGKSFDHKVLNWRLNLLELPPLRKSLIIDTLQMSRQSFRSPSHRLDYRSKAYGLGGKIAMRLQDWIDLVEGDEKALGKMVKYGVKDVEDLRRLFWKELPYYKNLPSSLALLVYPHMKSAKPYCTKCASRHRPQFDVVPAKVNNRRYYKCANCSNTWEV